ncbi:MAG: NirA family protein [Akkermansiaceae bacterium]
MITNAAFSEEQKQYLAERIKASYPFLGQNASGQFTNQPDEAVAENVHGVAIDDLCKEEQIKYEKHGLDVWDDIVKNADIDQFPESADSFRYKFYGLFHVAPVQDSFMMRVRIPGCKISSYQFRGLAEIAADWGGGYTDITTRGNLQVREIMPRDTVDTLIKLNELGLTSKGAGADNVRNITANPTSGFDPQELIDVLPLAKAMHYAILNNRDLYGLPRKFNIAFDSGGVITAAADTNDVGFYATEVKQGHGQEGVDPGIYFRLQLCGISGHKQLATDCGLLVKPEEAVALSAAILRVFIENGDRENRKKSRFKYLVDDWGVPKLLEEVQKKLAFPLVYFPEEKCEAMPVKGRQAHFGVHPQKQEGLNYVGVITPVGRLLPEQMHALADLVDRYGNGDMRLTVWQNIIIPNVPDDQVEPFLKALDEQGFKTSTTSISGGLVACTGNTGCKYAAANTKGQSIELAKYLESKIELDQPINIHFTGCPNSCAQHYVGDIGMQGAPCKVNGETVEGYHIVVGGGIDDNRGIAKDLFQSVPYTEVPEKVERMLSNYLKKREPAESFCAFTRRYTTEELQTIFTA